MKFISILSPKNTLKLMNFWPPFFFSGIKINSVNRDLSEVEVRLKLSFFNQNYFGTHFGGSLFSMCDPFYAFILLHHLGKDYVVWDIGAEINFKKAVSCEVKAVFSLSKEQIKEIKKECANGNRYEPEFRANVVDLDGNIIAEVRKKVYVKKKRKKLVTN